MSSLVFHGLNLNSLNLHGHRYVNFVLAIAMEVPGGFFAGFLSDKFGRRWLQVVCFCITGICCVVAAFASLNADSSSTVAVMVTANIAK